MKPLKSLSLFLLLSTTCLAAESGLTLFERFWLEARDTIYPSSLETDYFTRANYQLLKDQIAQTDSIDAVADVLNEFLGQLGVSHTGFYTESDPDYYMLQSLFAYQDIESPQVNHAGMQVALINGRYRVKAVLYGFPAQRAGLRRGDLLLEVDGNRFHPVWSFNERGTDNLIESAHDITYSRDGVVRKARLTPVRGSLHAAFRQATLDSAKVFNEQDFSIGYLHLWTGTFPDSAAVLQYLATEQLADTDALILDLRDGFGGAFWEHLDPFFEDRGDFFTVTTVARDGSTGSMVPGEKESAGHYSRPMVVLINEGTRSGKELMAYQFRKSGRALLIGTGTAGYAVAGRGMLSEPENPYILYLSSGGFLVDGEDLEGRGVQPHIEVDYPADAHVETDPQLARARVELLRLVSRQGAGGELQTASDF